MKKLFTSLLIGCSLSLAGAALAQQPDQQSTPKKKQGAEKAHAAQGAPGATPQERPGRQTGAMKGQGAANQPGATNEPGAGKGRKTRAGQESATGAQTGTGVSGQPAASATPGAEQPRKGMKGRAAKASATPATSPAAATGAVSATPAAGASAAPTVSATGQQKGQANATGGTKKADPQKVQQVKAQAPQIKAQHANFHAQPKPQQVPPVTFNQNRRIEGSDQWQGAQYEAFRSYHSERHDQGWYRSRYNRVELIGGGYYYWNSGYWYPAWGYNPSAEYYAYDGPIYVGQRAEPPDRVIADVQTELQQMGYYQGEVDGLLGPMTRQALTDYQADQGLTTTAAIDQPTLDSLGLS